MRGGKGENEKDEQGKGQKEKGACRKAVFTKGGKGKGDSAGRLSGTMVDAHGCVCVWEGVCGMRVGRARVRSKRVHSGNLIGVWRGWHNRDKGASLWGSDLGITE